MANTQAEEPVFDKLLAGHAPKSCFVHALRPSDHLVGDGFVIEVAIRFTMGEHMPNGDQQFTGDSDDGLVGVLTAFLEMFVLSFPVRIAADGAPGGFDESPSEFLTAGFCDTFFLMFQATVMNTSTETSITDQVLSVHEASDVADGRKHGHGENHAEAGDLHKEDHVVGPGVAVAEAGQFLMDGFFVCGEMLKNEQILLDLKVHHGGEILLLPPGEIDFREKRALRGYQVEAVDETVQAVLGHGDLFMDTPAMGDQSPQIADMMRGHPYFWDDTGDEQDDQSFDIEFIGLDLGASDLADFQGIGDHDISRQWGDQIIDIPGVGSGFDDHGIGGS